MNNTSAAGANEASAALCDMELGCEQGLQFNMQIDVQPVDESWYFGAEGSDRHVLHCTTLTASEESPLFHTTTNRAALQFFVHLFGSAFFAISLNSYPSP